MLTKRGIGAVLLGMAVFARAQASVAETDAETARRVDDYIRAATSPVGYLVVGSFKSYVAATKHVEMVHALTGIPVELRNLSFSKGVLSLDSGECERNGMAWSATECWVPRGREGSGDVTLSIERSDWYPPMKPGYYVVVAMAGGDEDLATARAALAPAKVRSYVTYVPTYFGCTR